MRAACLARSSSKVTDRAVANAHSRRIIPWAFGPRLGVAWQVHPKWVVRAGVGVAYTRNESNNGKNNNSGSVNPYAAASYGDPAFLMQDGIPYTVSFPELQSRPVAFTRSAFEPNQHA